MQIRRLICLVAFLVAVLAATPAWARPCCSECPSWPDLDPYNDPCARVCAFDCFAAQPQPILRSTPLTSSDVASTALQQIFAKPGPQAAGSAVAAEPAAETRR